MNMLKGYPNDMPHVFNHVLDVVGGLGPVRVDEDLLYAWVILRVDLVLGCSKFGLDLDHTAFLLVCKNNLLSNR
jgi:hypothetical protein